jgi:hypothetical protein
VCRAEAHRRHLRACQRRLCAPGAPAVFLDWGGEQRERGRGREDFVSRVRTECCMLCDCL